MKRIRCEEIAAGKWLALKKIYYLDNHGKERIWESAARQKTSGAVAIICTLKPSGRLILIRQYRPPADNLVIEFPAGLIDPGESPAEAAVRELREETGYHGKVLKMIPDAFSSPGLSSELVRIAIMEADENAQESLQTDFDETEDIETFLVSPSEMNAFLEKVMKEGNQVDGRVSAFAAGYSMK